MRDIIIDLQSSDTCKIQLKIAINFISSRDAEEEHLMHSNIENIKFESYNDGNKIVNELFESLCSGYQDNLEISMREKELVFDSVQTLQMS